MRLSTFDPAAESVQRSGWATLGGLLPYLWPAGKPWLKLRVVLALVFLGAAIGIAATVPFLLKWAVDALTGTDGAAIAAPVALIVAYGAARVLQQAFGEMRDA
ncbi:MAG: hypothetical protein MI806_21750, partial [Minwuiales bacterium]|nr:hypothetical protein [Minwuiales bacterium]